MYHRIIITCVTNVSTCKFDFDSINIILKCQIVVCSHTSIDSKSLKKIPAFQIIPIIELLIVDRVIVESVKCYLINLQQVKNNSVK